MADDGATVTALDTESHIAHKTSRWPPAAASQARGSGCLVEPAARVEGEARV